MALDTAPRRRATALESFTPQAIYPDNNWGSKKSVGPVTALSATMAPYSVQNNYGKVIELLKHFTYWNYCAVNLIASRSSEPIPLLSYKTNMAAKAAMGKPEQSLSKTQRDWVKSKYSVIQSTQDDLDPLPENHPLAQLIACPNDEDTWHEFAYEHFLFLELTGQVYWWVIPNGFGLPCQVCVIPTQWVLPDINADGQIYQYSIVPNGGAVRLITLPPEQVARGMKKNPRNKRIGLAPTEAAPYWTANSESIEISRNASFTQGTNPDVLLELDATYSDPSDEVLERIKEKFIRRASGVRRSGAPVITPPGVKATKWSNTPREMDYGTTGDAARDANLALHNVPKVLLGVTTDVNRATVDGANVIFCENKINPGLTHFAGMLTKYLAQPYDPRIVVWYEDVTPKNELLDLQKDQADFAMGAVTPDEVRQKRGRAAIGEPAYESGYLPAGLHPISEEMNDIMDERAAAAMGLEGEGNEPEDDSGNESPDDPANDTEDAEDAAGETPPPASKKPAGKVKTKSAQSAKPSLASFFN